MSPCSADEQKERMIGMTKRLNLLLEFVMLTLGAVIAAFAIEEFLVPNTILDGNISQYSYDRFKCSISYYRIETAWKNVYS